MSACKSYHGWRAALATAPDCKSDALTGNGVRLPGYPPNNFIKAQRSQYESK